MRIMKNSALFASAFLTAALIASPLAMADSQDRRGHQGDRDGKRNYSQLCERISQGESRPGHAGVRERMQQRHEQMAERLQLTDEQRVIWQEIQDERREQAKERFERLKERCAAQDA